MVAAITQVWEAVVTFLISLFTKITALFYTPGTGDAAGSLTFVGTMAVIMAGVAILLLVFNLIRSFFPMRG